jgi:hypothetical protein
MRRVVGGVITVVVAFVAGALAWLLFPAAAREQHWFCEWAPRDGGMWFCDNMALIIPTLAVATLTVTVVLAVGLTLTFRRGGGSGPRSR